jgi:hypothetical protein
MKKVWWLAVCLLLVSFVYGENLYQYDSLELELDIQGELELIAEKSGAKVSSVKTELMLYPGDSFRQTLLEWDSIGAVEQNEVVFEWNDKKLGEKEYGFKAKIKTEDERIEINKKISFPLTNVESYEKYLEATEHIDKNYPKIVEKATELAEGEDDLFRVVFKLAKWVEENVRYDLNTLTASTSQKASWVLEQRQGVCDEMTSLFIAMCRTLGIPAKFVSGVSYTTSDLFEENWLPHGWAEVYFPNHGWVSFDIAFGEYGYVDVTHIKLREGFDPAEASTKFKWVANDVKLESEELTFSVAVKDRGELSKSEISLEEEILGKEVSPGSYNLIKSIVENKLYSYTATTLKLAVPKEVEIIGEEKKTILLEPRGIKEVEWMVKVDEDLLEQYWYEFPAVIYSEKNISVKGNFKAMKEGVFYSKEEIESLMLKDEEKRILRKIELKCDYETEIKLGEEKEIACTIKNRGNMNLKEINFCLEELCKIIDLPINQEGELKIQIEGDKIGWQKLMASAENGDIDERSLLVYAILDNPKIISTIEIPDAVSYGEDFTISLTINQDSFSVPEKLTVILEGRSHKNKWKMDELRGEQKFSAELNSRGLGKENKFKMKLLWEDKFGEKFEEEKTIPIKVKGRNLWEKTVMWFNRIIIFFTK